MQDTLVAHWRPLSLAAVLLLSACAQQAPLTETAMPLPTVPMSPVANKQAQLYGAQAMAAPAAVGMDRRAIILPPEYRPPVQNTEQYGEIRDNPDLVPTAEGMTHLFPLKPLPAKAERARTRIWTAIKSGV